MSAISVWADLDRRAAPASTTGQGRASADRPGRTPAGRPGRTLAGQAGGAPVNVVVSTDGGSRGNPGPAGIGAVVATPGGKVLAEVAEGIGWATNNVAEYRAVIAGLERARSLGARRVRVRADSQLLVQQLNGVYRVRNPGLAPLWAEVKRLARSFEQVTFEHVPRGRNRAADALANRAMDAQGAVGSPAQGTRTSPAG